MRTRLVVFVARSVAVTVIVLRPLIRLALAL